MVSQTRAMIETWFNFRCQGIWRICSINAMNPIEQCWFWYYPQNVFFLKRFSFSLKSHQWNRQHEHQKQINRFGKAKDSERNSDAMGFLHLSAGGGFLLKRLRFIWRPSIHMASIFAPLWGYSCDSCAVGSPGGDDSYIYIYPILAV